METNLKLNNKQKASFVGLVILLVSSGFIKDFCMLNINHVLKFLQNGINDYAYPSFFFLEKWTVREILILKWVLTIFFFFYFWLVSYGVLYSYFNPKGKRIKTISYVYIALFSLAGLFYTTGFIIGIDKSMYHVVRTLTGLTHSFMPAMIVFLYLKYFPENNTLAK